MLAERLAYSRVLNIGTLATILVLFFSITALGLRFVHAEVVFSILACLLSYRLATRMADGLSGLGTRDLTWKLEKYRPGYYLALGEEKPTVPELNEVYELQQLVSYDVFGNYYGGKQVQLYKLNLRP